MKRPTEKLASASPRYARLLKSVQEADARRRALVKFLRQRRQRMNFQQALCEVGAAG